MNDRPQVVLYEEQVFSIGQDTFIDSTAENNNAVVFEDNNETGYFYAIGRNNDKLDVLDALHIYNVANVTDKEKPSTLKILWSEDLTKAFLSINNYYHAVFDFENKAGYCRTGFPKSSNKWTLIAERHLTDDLLIELSRNKN
ncbi:MULTISPECIES: DUF2251 domain-containing protein [Sphingobacterium]|jgi:hypothetical protein|nr:MULTISPECIES: DUF2251 domain-containing protein [Sphingobacterium]MCW2263975.1 hypothetical protein [Sphingobacterium kitahiroshimense]NJI73294.1 DUF2251 domain-containing protein [Sphingobacterium sp. B16(2022)]TCR01725.1 uncharacterized protein DUF2251 [Sphingobacterium sp. JUb78]